MGLVGLVVVIGIAILINHFNARAWTIVSQKIEAANYGGLFVSGHWAGTQASAGIAQQTSSPAAIALHQVEASDFDREIGTLFAPRPAKWLVEGIRTVCEFT